MKKFTALVALVLLIVSGLSYAGPVELLTTEPNTSTWVCSPIDITIGNSDWYAGISRAPGLNGSYWRTEGTLTSLSVSENPEDSVVKLNVYGESTATTLEIPITPWTSMGSPDVVETLALPDGVYVINAEYDPNLSVTFRTYNDLGTGGTYGATLPKLTALSKSFVVWPAQVGRRWLYVVVLDNASFYVALYNYDGTVAYVGEVDASAFGQGYLYKYSIGSDIGFAVIERKPPTGGQPGGYVYNPMILPYGTGVDNLTGAPNIFTATPAIF